MLLPRLHFSTLFQTKCFSWTSVVLLFLLGVFFVVVVIVAFVGSEGVAANANEDRRNDLVRE